MQEESSQAALVDCGSGFSPRVESTTPGTVIVDFAGAERLLGTPQQIGRGLTKTRGRMWFYRKSRFRKKNDTSLHAAIGMDGIAVIAPGKESVCLSRLPIEVLNPDAGILSRMLLVTAITYRDFFRV